MALPGTSCCAASGGDAPVTTVSLDRNSHRYSVERESVYSSTPLPFTCMRQASSPTEIAGVTPNNASVQMRPTFIHHHPHSHVAVTTGTGAPLTPLSLPNATVSQPLLCPPSLTAPSSLRTPCDSLTCNVDHLHSQLTSQPI